MSRTLSRNERKFAVTVALATLLICSMLRPLPAFAAFADSKPRTASFTTITLQAPASLSAEPNGSNSKCGVNLTWTAPQPGVPTSWVIQRYVGTTPSGSAQTVAGTATSFTDDNNISRWATYSWKIQAVVGSWTSSATSSSAEFIGLFCT